MNEWMNEKFNNKDTRKTSMRSFSCLYCYCWRDFTHCSGVFIVDFEEVTDGWVRSSIHYYIKFLNLFSTISSIDCLAAYMDIVYV